MNIILVSSVLLRVFAVIYGVILAVRIRDWRLGFLAVMLFLMLTRQSLTLLSDLGILNTPVFQFPTELPGLLVSIMALLTVYFISDLITEQRAVNTHIKKYRNLIQNSLNEIYLFDAETYKFIEVNRGALDNLGYTLEELKNFTPIDLKPEYDREKFRQLVQPLVTGTSDKLVFETVHQRKDQSVYDVEVHLQLQKEEGFFYAIILNISERKNANDELLKSERRLRALIDTVPSMIFAQDLKGHILVANKRLAEVFDQNVDEITGHLIDKLSDKKDLSSAIFENIVPREDYSSLNFNTQEFCIKSGAEQNWIQTNKIFYDGDGFGEPVIVGCVTDISKQKTAQEELNQNKAFLDSVINGIIDPIFVKDENRKYIVVNDAVCKLTGISRNRFIGLSDENIFSPQLLKFFGDQDQSVLSDGKAVVYEDKICIEGVDHYISASKSCFIHPASFEPNLVCTLRDITKVKETEEALRSMQKMDAVGKLTGGIAHDFNNLLGIILGNLELLKSSHELEQSHKARFDAIEKATNRAATLTRQLLGTSRVKPHARTVCDINNIIHNMDELVSRSLTPSIGLEKSLADNLWQVKIDIGDFEDALLNLILNARDAMKEGGNLSIKTANVNLKEADCRNDPNSKAGDYVELTIADNGVGMAENILERIFEPYFSTKRPDKGSGLGLAMVFGFVKRSEGHIQVSSEPQLGTTFSIYIPREVERL